MELAKIYVSESCAQVISKKPIPAGLVGGYIDVVYAEDLWADLSKTVVFRSNITRDVVTDGRRVPVPADVLAAGVRLWVGFFGVAGDKALPTFWSSLGTVGEAADPSGEESTDPNLPVWAQILDKTAELEKKVEREYQPKGDYLESSQLQPAIGTALAQAKESGAFDGPPGKDGADGQPGKDGKDGADGSPGKDGINGQDGAPGKDGIDGQDGAPGKSAYEYAKDGGYIGTEEEFAAKLAEENPGSSDWNAAEGEPGYVKNRTHWADRTETVLIPAGDYPVSHYDNSIFDTDEFYHCRPIKEGKKYLVNIAGNSMECVARKATREELTGGSAFGFEIPYIGNMAIIVAAWGDDYDSLREEVDTGEQFLFLVYNPEDPEQTDGTLYFPVDESLPDNIAVSITEIDETIHKLEKKYLPDGIGSADWNASEGQPGHVLNRTHWMETVTVVPTFDGNLTGRETVFVNDGIYAVKITPQSVSVEELIGATMVMDMGGTEQSIPLTAETAMDAYEVMGASGSLVLMDGQPVVFSLSDDAVVQGISLSAGTWGMCVVGQFYVKTLSCLQPGEYEVVHKMDVKFLPAIGVNAEPFTFMGMDGENEYQSGSYAYFTPTVAMKEQIKSGVIKLAFNFKPIGSTESSQVSVVLNGDAKEAFGSFVKSTAKTGIVRYGVSLELETNVNYAKIAIKPLYCDNGDTAGVYPIVQSGSGAFYISVDTEGNVRATKLS